MEIPIFNGIYTNNSSDYRTTLPINLVPVPKSTGLSRGYLRPAEGAAVFSYGAGVDRGGINWKGECYRASGYYLNHIAEDGTATNLGFIDSDGKQATLEYSFTHLGIASAGKLYLYDGTTLTQVTDPNLGTCIDVLFLDGFWISTDGESMIVSDLTNPFSFNPLNFAFSDIDPDPIVALMTIRNELIAINRYSIEFFANQASPEGFPFSRVEGAQITRGAVGTHAVVKYNEQIAFVGGGRNEPPAVWMGYSGQSQKISTREIDQILSGYTESQLADIVLSVRVFDSHNHLWIALPDQTLVFDLNASQASETPVWFKLWGGVDMDTPTQYPIVNPVWVYDSWVVGNAVTNRVGKLRNDVSSLFGETVGWEFQTNIIFNQTNGALIHELELVGLPGRAALGNNPTISTQYSIDGITWSNPRYASVGKQGNTTKRVVWLQQGHMRTQRIQRFRGTSDAHFSTAVLNAEIEGLYV